MEKTNNVSSYILSVFYRHSNNFISTMLVGNNIALVIYGILMAQLIEHYILADVISNQALLVPIETVISTLIILVTGEFLPKTLFKINPNATLKFFSVPTFACYIILYPISRFSSLLSSGILHLVGVKTNKEDREKHLPKSIWITLSKVVSKKAKREKKLTMKSRYSVTHLISPMSKYVTA